MRKMLIFAHRNAKEMLRDPLTLSFGIGLPIVLILLLSAINKNIPGSNEVFAISQLAPGICVFSLSFIALFSGMLLSKDRSGAFMMRLLVSPLSGSSFIAGYLLPLIPISAAQSAVCLIVAVIMGLDFTPRILLVLAVLLPCSVFFACFGLMCGSVFNEKQVGGVLGAMLTNLSAWLSGAWFEPSMVGGVFEKIASFLPFWHAVKAARAVLAGEYSRVMPELWWVIGWAAVMFVLSVTVFSIKRKRN